MKIELCVASVEAIKVARELNFDRIELCQNLEQGGQTPSPGFIEYALACGVETHVLIRPRSGGFFYEPEEIEIMLRDIGECKAIGVHGVVVGVLDERGLVDQRSMELMRKRAEGIELTFHRAFDDTLDAFKAIDELVALGVDRILSSGQARNVELGMEMLASMKSYAGNKIQIMPGGGVSAANVKRIREFVHPDAIHFSGTVKHLLDEDSMFSETVLKIDRKRIERILHELTY